MRSHKALLSPSTKPHIVFPVGVSRSSQVENCVGQKWMGEKFNGGKF